MIDGIIKPINIFTGGIIMAGGKLLFKAVFGAVMLWSSAVMAQYYGDSVKDQPTIYVIGEAEIRVVPDRAIITLAVKSIDSTIVAAKKINDRIVDAISKVLKKYGVDNTDIQTNFLNIEPKYKKARDYQGVEVEIFLGYDVKRQLAIVLKDVSRLDDLLTGIIEKGADKILGVRFFTDELRKYRDQARVMAIKAAYDKARDLTAEIGQTVGKAISIKEGKSAWRSWYRGLDWDRANSSVPFKSQNVTELDFNGDMPLAVGKISVIASVSVSFLLE
jgi:uncharacterized protein YggE